VPGTLVLGAPDVLCVSGLRTFAPAPLAGPGPALTPVSPALRRPLGRVADVPPAERLERVLRAADSGQSADAIREASELLVEDPLNAEAYFLRGLVQLEAGDAPAAVKSLRGALYLSPTFGPAAFKLARAYETLGDRAAARRAYEQALRTIEHGHDDHDPVLDQVDLGDVAAACEARIVALQ
jgi:tetratricopeptide (TPR) repeat protein